MFDRICHEHGIEHRLTQVNHPWTNGQVERMNRTIKDATVKRYHYDSHDQLRTHLQLFVNAYNHARRLKTLRGLTPYEHVLQAWTKEPKRFRLDPSHHIPGPYSHELPGLDGAGHVLSAVQGRGLSVKRSWGRAGAFTGACRAEECQIAIDGDPRILRIHIRQPSNEQHI